MSSKFKMKRQVKAWYNKQFYDWFIKAWEHEEFEPAEVRSMHEAKSFIHYLNDNLKHQVEADIILEQQELVYAIIHRTNVTMEKIIFMTKFYHDLLDIPMKNLKVLWNWSDSLASLIALTEFGGEVANYAHIWLDEITVNSSVEFIRNTRNVKKVIFPINFEDDLLMVYDISTYTLSECE